MRPRDKEDQEAIDLHPKVYAKGFSLGEKAYNNGHGWAYVDTISGRKEGATEARYAYWCGLWEGYHEAEEISENYYQPVEA